MNTEYLIKSLYRGFLGREPEPEGLQYWINELNNGIDEGKVCLQFLNSEECKNKFDRFEVENDPNNNPDEQIVRQIITSRTKSILAKISPHLKVLNGPFKGLKYPSQDICEWTLLSKIVGSYESNLHNLITNIIKTPYSDVINIGSADGYYAVGLASKMHDAVIHCFDINEHDIIFSKEMANYNKVKNLTFNTICTPQTIINFSFNGKGLIICDCEGCELKLFSKDVIDSLTNIDVLVELHDVYNPVISTELIKNFRNTHYVKIINNRHQETSQFKGLEILSEEDRLFSYIEHRGGLNKNIFMEWAFFTSKKAIL